MAKANDAWPAKKVKMKGVILMGNSCLVNVLMDNGSPCRDSDFISCLEALSALIMIRYCH
jgi:hypothetical protein